MFFFKISSHFCLFEQISRYNFLNRLPLHMLKLSIIWSCSFRRGCFYKFKQPWTDDNDKKMTSAFSPGFIKGYSAYFLESKTLKVTTHIYSIKFNHYYKTRLGMIILFLIYKILVPRKQFLALTFRQATVCNVYSHNV